MAAYRQALRLRRELSLSPYSQETRVINCYRSSPPNRVFRSWGYLPGALVQFLFAVIDCDGFAI